jgi:hypothetical protein
MIQIGSHVKTTEEYKNKMYEPLYHEKILDGEVLDINKDNVVTIKLIETSCDFSKRFNYHMNTWKVGNMIEIGLGWLEEV